MSYSDCNDCFYCTILINFQLRTEIKVLRFRGVEQIEEF
jgi:hypothetical protein